MKLTERTWDGDMFYQTMRSEQELADVLEQGEVLMERGFTPYVMAMTELTIRVAWAITKKDGVTVYAAMRAPRVLWSWMLENQNKVGAAVGGWDKVYDLIKTQKKTVVKEKVNADA